MDVWANDMNFIDFDLCLVWMERVWLDQRLHITKQTNASWKSDAVLSSIKALSVLGIAEDFWVSAPHFDGSRMLFLSYPEELSQWVVGG